ncbi:LLM class flavin-dependent oxidoreductase [Dactylosporangium sp. CA-052675]|uniref:LLM class flavin-dependent oxidoreductase n=1 Tax=Dactylosporangium sp. CA-052675 TaxID=3239927 RepID=UPI003D91559E
MRLGICVCTLGDFAEPALVVDVSVAAEAAGWEYLFVWDHLAFAWGVPSADAWVTLAAVAQATSAIRIGTAVTPLPRRRPAVVAGSVATLPALEPTLRAGCTRRHQAGSRGARRGEATGLRRRR